MKQHSGIYSALFPHTPVWIFKSSSEAYAKGKTKAVSHGEILFIPSEGVVGFADHKFKEPFALTQKHGKLKNVFKEYKNLNYDDDNIILGHCDNLCISKGSYTCASFVSFTMDEVLA